MVPLWRIYLFSYTVALRSIIGPHFKDALRLILEPCNYWRNVEVPAVLSQLEIKPGEKVLDVGSPKLPSLFIWKRLGAEVWSTDLFPYFFEEYSHHKRRLLSAASADTYHIEVQDARKLTYPDSFFDKIYSISVFEHIEDDGDSLAMKEIARVLKPGGVCCLTVPAARRYSEETIDRETYYKKPLDGKPIFYQRHYDESTLHSRLVDPSGLVLLIVERFGERWIRFEGLYARLPRLIKISISPLGPLFSKLFLYSAKSSVAVDPKAALIVLRKPAMTAEAGQ